MCENDVRYKDKIYLHMYMKQYNNLVNLPNFITMTIMNPS